MSLPRRRGRRPVKIRLLKAARAHRDDTSRSFRAAAHVRGTDTPKSPATPQKPYRAPSRYFKHVEGQLSFDDLLKLADKQEGEQDGEQVRRDGPRPLGTVAA